MAPGQLVQTTDAQMQKGNAIAEPEGPAAGII